MDSLHNIKKYLLLLFIITICTLSACTEKNEVNLNENRESHDEGGESVLTDDMINESYQKAVEAYSWFDATTMPVDYSDRKELYGFEYYKVTHDTIKSCADLKSYLQTLFSDDIVEKLLAGDGSIIRYRDIDGALYAIPADRGSDITKGKETYEIVRESDTKILYKVFVEIYDDPVSQNVTGTEEHDFQYECINGRWVFTNFELVR